MRFTTLVARVMTVSAALASGVSAQILPREPINTSPTVYAGTPPTGFRVASSTPASVSFTWAGAANATGYTILRTTGVGQPWTTVTPTPLPPSAVNFNDQTGVDYRSSYIYRLQANYSGTPPGYVDLPVTLPAPVNPTGFTARQTGEGTAELSWQAVPNASYYWIWGPGTGTEGVRADGTAKTFSGIGTGPKEWSITTRYDPAGILLASSTWPKAQLSMVSKTGNYRITLNGFEVLQNGADDILNSDGAGGEVFALAYVRAYDRTSGRLLSEGAVESAVHGDTEGFGGRVPAGSAKPTGGLINGDKYPSATPWSRPSGSVSSTTFPLVVWEGPLTEAGEAVVITPMLWEWDGTRTSNPRDRLEGAKRDFGATSQSAWSTVASALAGSGSWSGPSQVTLNWVDEQWGISSAQEGSQYVVHHPVAGPVQSNKYRKQWIAQPNAFVFTRELIEKSLNASSQIGGYGPGVIAVKWEEKSPGGKGNYVLYLQFARQ